MFPKLNRLPASRKVISQFFGLDLRNAIGNGSFADMENLTSDGYPLLSVRKSRGMVANIGPLGGMVTKDGLCYVNGRDFVINGQSVDLALTDGEKQLVSMGAYVVIFPDKKYINTLSPEDNGSLEASYTAQGQVQFSLCNGDGEALEGLCVQPQAPETPGDLQYWLDTSVTPCVLRRYTTASETWVAVSTYVRLDAVGIGALFARDDGVEISGIAAANLQSLNGSTVLRAVGENFVVIPGILEGVVTQSLDQGVITLERYVPEMDFVTESDNRLWGCRYGFDRNGNVVNTLYACKLGDFKNWNSFQGLSTDSYRVSLGADGPFTGAVTHLGYPVFFREDCLHKVYGSYPADYRVQTTACRGVQLGSHKSLAIVNGVLFYLSGSGVCAYDGSLPELVSHALGQQRFSDGVAGVLGSKYYISMTDSRGTPGLYVLDTLQNLWYREDHLQARCFATRGESLFCHDGQVIWDLAGTGEPEGQVHWMAQTGLLNAADPDAHYIRQLTARLSLDTGTQCQFYVRYDGQGDWELLGLAQGQGLGSFCLPMRTRRCRCLELRLEGTGPARLHSLALTAERGSDWL